MTTRGMGCGQEVGGGGDKENRKQEYVLFPVDHLASVSQLLFFFLILH